MPSNTEADEARYFWAIHGQPTRYDAGRYGTGEIVDRREAEEDAR